jgi:hypothetical protein
MGFDDRDGTASPYSGGGAGATSGTPDVELTFEDVEKIGRDTAALAGTADSARTAVAGTKGDPGYFGQYPMAQQVFAQHQAVASVFEETLGSVSTDIDDFGHTIIQAVHQHAQTDDEVLGSLTTVASTLKGGNPLRDTFDHARNQAGYDLLDVQLDGEEQQQLGQAHPAVEPAIDALGAETVTDVGDSPTIAFDPSGPR